MNELGEITLQSGRVITLTQLHQRRTYEGLLEGLPTSEMNARQIRGIVSVQLRTAPGGAVHLIEPIETPVEGAIPGRGYARIPTITCVGRFQSQQAARVQMCASELTVIWFQESFSPSIAPAALAELVKTPWEALAHDFDF